MASPYLLSPTLTDKLVVATAFVTALFIYLRNASYRQMPYPPGPKGLPLLGNLLDLPRTSAWETYERWSKKFGSNILHLRVLGQDVIVLNSFELAIDLLDGRSLIYSDRPRSVMVYELMGWNWFFSGMPYGRRWKDRRRLFSQYFNNRNARQYRTRQIYFVRKALSRLLDHSEDFLSIVRHMTGATAISLAYGVDVQDDNDPFVNMSQLAFDTALEASVPGAFLVDVIPWLKYVPAWVPGAGFQRKAKEWRKLQEDVHELPFATTAKKTAEGTAKPSLTSYFLEKLKDNGENAEHQKSVIKDTAGMVFGGASETTASAVESFLVAMLRFPEVQKKAQDQLDRILNGRLPDFEDEDDLPYISAIVKEVLRWKPVVPFGIPHQVSENDVSEGYCIPKGAWVIANSWAMLQDPEAYPDPSTFRPERFLTEDGRLNPDVRDPRFMVFGFGRRIMILVQLAASSRDKLILFVTLTLILFTYLKSRRRALPYPPGPKKLPLLGNLLNLPQTFGWEVYSRWGKELGSDIIHLQAFGRDLIVLNSLKVATDLLDRKSLIYSGRPHLTMTNELMGWNWFFSSMPYGNAWKERRRLFLQYFSNRNKHLYQSRQTHFIRKTLAHLLDHNDDVLGTIRHMAGGIAISLAYGVQVQNTNDPFVEMSEIAVQSALDATIPGAFLVDVMPWLKYIPSWVPGAGFQKKAREWRKLQEEVHELPYSETIKSMTQGFAQPSLTSHSLEGLEGDSDTEYQKTVIKDTAGMVYAGATDTTASAIGTFLAAMLQFPEVQRKAQEELDRVLEGRLPEFTDEENLPYISAIIKEVLRWKPVAPLGIPHQLTEDDVYEGYHIPKGSFVFANSWAMLHDEELYPDPSFFKPERFLTKDGRLNRDVRDPSMVAFGFGRRVCPGAQMGTSMLWLWAASFLATFNISNPLSEDGAPMKPSIEYRSVSLTFHPLPFKCTIKARSKSFEELIRSQAPSDT
ncbi:hypothetical protein CVT26_004978 [Gymnopilus dilepis]|uniref:Cytochrome P450 n=1 Tax=Gymnopilus dilepis TaxID=231916 RepID=A0A409Y040_9AGAR|nr:hypothetical protein CVT26_004978 [Gymnopilus dilepis]